MCGCWSISNETRGVALSLIEGVQNSKGGQSAALLDFCDESQHGRALNGVRIGMSEADVVDERLHVVNTQEKTPRLIGAFSALDLSVQRRVHLWIGLQRTPKPEYRAVEVALRASSDLFSRTDVRDSGILQVIFPMPVGVIADQ